MFVDPIMAQNISAEDNAQNSIGERQIIDRGRTYRPAAFDCRTEASLEVEIRPDYGSAAVVLRQPRKKPASPATGIEHRQIGSRQPRSLRGHKQVRVHRG